MQETSLAPGLYLVATPIGNLEDITYRALRVLRSADRIACEDTRQTQKLLNHFEINTPTLSLYEFNEADRSASIVADLKQGARIAVVSDAGMPGICDPGMFLTKAAIEAGIAVYPIPGANAALSALVASGLNTEHFLFAGFLPPKPGARRTQLEQMRDAISGEQTLVFYEAPHRIAETLEDIEYVWGPACHVVVARELTKLHEEFLRGSVSEVREQLGSRERIRGEIVLLVQALPLAVGQQSAELPLTERIAELARAEGLDEMAALKRIAKERGVSKSELYRELQRTRPSGGRKN
ncbi:16S rRNA (cytidine(1402)-2'-O)-methyltransferase [Silvibacterium acidisoli]|uniref:16S rRNA (cytidine(1402)-2'-O)-methyltransferase n=1 Tax=Acidobacteriaceae bacterium ZG23-2 TaxID=2883246 RepID=UPI00406CAF83